MSKPMVSLLTVLAIASTLSGCGTLLGPAPVDSQEAALMSVKATENQAVNRRYVQIKKIVADGLTGYRERINKDNRDLVQERCALSSTMSQIKEVTFGQKDPLLLQIANVVDDAVTRTNAREKEFDGLPLVPWHQEKYDQMVTECLNIQTRALQRIYDIVQSQLGAR